MKIRTSTNPTLFPMVEVRNSIAALLPSASRHLKIGLPPAPITLRRAVRWHPTRPLFNLTRPESPSLTASGLNPKPTMSQNAATD